MLASVSRSCGCRAFWSYCVDSLGPEVAWRISGLWSLSVPVWHFRAVFCAGMVAHLHLCDCLMACTCWLIVGHGDCRQGRAHRRVLGRIIFTWDQKQGQEPNVHLIPNPGDPCAPCLEATDILGLFVQVEIDARILPG